MIEAILGILSGSVPLVTAYFNYRLKLLDNKLKNCEESHKSAKEKLIELERLHYENKAQIRKSE